MSNNVYHSSTVWLLLGIHASKGGTLTLNKGRLSYVLDENNETLFDVAVDEVKDLDFPWMYFGGGADLWVGGKKYRLSFVEPHLSDTLGDGLANARQWKPLLTANIASKK